MLCFPTFHTQVADTSRQRQDELTRKISKAFEEGLGTRRWEMVYIRLLFADPSTQGKGYGYGLANVATSRVKQLRLLRLQSSSHSTVYTG